MVQEESPVDINISWFSFDSGEMCIYEPSAYVSIFMVESSTSLA